jgi:hypothetical protein
MSDFLKMDIFFVVATVATVLIAALIIVLLVYAVRLMQTLNRIGEEVEEEAKAIREDIHDARSSVRGFSLARVFSLFGKTAKRATSRAKRKQ